MWTWRTTKMRTRQQLRWRRRQRPRPPAEIGPAAAPRPPTTRYPLDFLPPSLLSHHCWLPTRSVQWWIGLTLAEGDTPVLRSPHPTKCDDGSAHALRPPAYPPQPAAEPLQLQPSRPVPPIPPCPHPRSPPRPLPSRCCGHLLQLRPPPQPNRIATPAPSPQRHVRPPPVRRSRHRALSPRPTA